LTEVAGYELGRLLGQGSFGQIYEATRAHKRDALKLIREEAVRQGFDERRFEREVRALQKAAGPHVVELIDARDTVVGNGSRYFVALEYLEGHDLPQAFLASNNSLDESTLKEIIIQIISGLETIHQQNIVHRDLKPVNVFLTQSRT
jgi:serine/threonine protein kinase